MPDVRPGPLVIASKLRARIKARGPAEVAALGLARTRELISSDRRLLFLARDLSAVDATATGRGPEGVEFREAGPEDAGRYERDIGTDAGHTFAARLSDRTRCFVVIGNGHFLHSTWITTSG